jgi:hypothetical protein
MKYMTVRMMLLISIFLCPAALSPQMPPQPGKLVISSDPVHATITINGNKVTQVTNATFMVSPGRYAIVVASQDGRLRCNGTLSVSAGQTATGSCTASGWK